MSNVTIYPLSDSPSLTLLEIDPLYEVTTVELDLDLLRTDPQKNLSLLRSKVNDLKFCSISAGTAKNYHLAYRRWTSFCAQYGLTEIPGSPRDVSACLVETLEATGSVAAVQMLSAAISFEHRLRGYASPTTIDDQVSMLLRGVKKVYGTPREPVDPLTFEHLKAMVDHLFSPSHGRNALKAPLKTWRTVWLAMINFHSLCRFGDIQNLKRNDLNFHSEPEPHLTFTLVGHKTDVYREGSERLIACNTTTPKYCVVRLTDLYLQYLGAGYKGPLLPNCLPNDRTKPNPAKTINYTTALEDFRELLTHLGYPAEKFGMHSGKRGGATNAVENGLDYIELQRVGHWKSPAMPLKYTDLSKRARLTISKRLQQI